MEAGEHGGIDVWSRQQIHNASPMIVVYKFGGVFNCFTAALEKMTTLVVFN